MKLADRKPKKDGEVIIVRRIHGSGRIAYIVYRSIVTCWVSTRNGLRPSKYDWHKEFSHPLESVARARKELIEDKILDDKIISECEVI